MKVNKKKLLYSAFVVYLLNFAGKQIDEVKKLQQENDILKKKLNNKWDQTELN